MNSLIKERLPSIFAELYVQCEERERSVQSNWGRLGV